ncbi:MAG: ATP-binding protein [Candidatus Nitrosocosmicus sp.]
MITICIVFVIISIILYQFLIDSANQLEDISEDNVKSTSVNIIKYLKELIENKLEVVTSNTRVLSNLELVRQENQSAISNLEVAQSTTSDFTEGYGWIDRNGRYIWSTAFTENETTYRNFANFNASDRPYFNVPKETFRPFISDSFTVSGYNQIPRIVVSYPVLSLKPNSIIIDNKEDNFSYNNDTNVNRLNPQINKFTQIFNDTITTNSFTDESERNLQLSNRNNISYLKDNFDFKGVIVSYIDIIRFNNFINNSIFQVSNDDEVSQDKNRASNFSVNSKLINDAYNFRHSQFSPSFMVVLQDNKGDILYSTDQSTEIESGINTTQPLHYGRKDLKENTSNSLFSFLRNTISNATESSSPSISRDVFNNNDNTSNSIGNEYEKVFDNTKFLINFLPIWSNGMPILYLSTATPYTLIEKSNELINAELFYIFLFIVVLLLVIFTFVVVVLRINKRLKNEVKDKTKKLQENVRALENANERLVQSEQMERDFLNTAAHELRTPTQAIMGYMELGYELFNDILKRSKVLEDKELIRDLALIHGHLKTIFSNSIRLDNLIRNLLDVAKIESNRNDSLNLHKEKLDLVKEINDSINKQLDLKIKGKNIKINFINQSFEGQYWVYADKLRLNQILNNIIENAIKFSPNNSIIDIQIKDYALDLSENTAKDNNEFEKQTKSNNSKIFVSISDRGRGISSKVMPRLFEKFITDSDTGTGLGLYITRNLVEAHGGKIWAYNNSDGAGSTFVFSLPKADVINT